MNKHVKRILTCLLIGVAGLACMGAISALVIQDVEALLACCAVTWVSCLLTVALHAVDMED